MQEEWRSFKEQERKIFDRKVNYVNFFEARFTKLSIELGNGVVSILVENKRQCPLAYERSWNSERQ
jgi:hypothetical protein